MREQPRKQWFRCLLRRARNEAVLCASFAAALLSALFVPPDAAYLTYIDLRVLCLLFALMAVVQGVSRCGLFDVLSQRLLGGERTLRALSLLLVLLPFFISMLMTNDVALIALVPFTLFLLRQAEAEALAVRVCVLQAVAANLGSMATPIGNPQNLYLHAHYALSAGQFFGTVLPLAAVSLAALVAAALLIAPPRGRVHVAFAQPARIADGRRLAAYAALLLLCLLAVFRLVHFAMAAGAALLLLLLCDRPLLRRIDYSLLLTFCCFFIFSGNLGRIPAVRALLESLLARSTLLCAAAASQCISNVPAAILLSGFTGDWRGLLAGVNVGGLGTPVASLASLIALRLYLKEPGARAGRFLSVFALANAAGLLLLLPLAALLA